MSSRSNASPTPAQPASANNAIRAAGKALASSSRALPNSGPAREPPAKPRSVPGPPRNQAAWMGVFPGPAKVAPPATSTAARSPNKGPPARSVSPGRTKVNVPVSAVISAHAPQRKPVGSSPRSPPTRTAMPSCSAGSAAMFGRNTSVSSNRCGRLQSVFTPAVR